MANPFVSVSIKLDTRKLDQLRGSLGNRAETVMDKAAADGERLTKDEIVNMHVVDTGTLLNSISWTREGRFTRVVSDATTYGVYQHEGFHFRNGRYWPGRPFMRAAFERLRPGLLKAWGALFQ